MWGELPRVGADGARPTEPRLASNSQTRLTQVRRITGGLSAIGATARRSDPRPRTRDDRILDRPLKIAASAALPARPASLGLIVCPIVNDWKRSARLRSGAGSLQKRSVRIVARRWRAERLLGPDCGAQALLSGRSRPTRTIRGRGGTGRLADPERPPPRPGRRAPLARTPSLSPLGASQNSGPWAIRQQPQGCSRPLRLCSLR